MNHEEIIDNLEKIANEKASKLCYEDIPVVLRDIESIMYRVQYIQFLSLYLFARSLDFLKDKNDESIISNIKEIKDVYIKAIEKIIDERIKRCLGEENKNV